MDGKQKDAMIGLMKEVGVADNEKAVKIAKIGVGIGVLGLIFGLAAIGIILQSNGIVGEVVDTVVLMGDVQNNHANLTMQDNQRIDRLEEEVFEKEEPLIKISHDTIKDYDLEYLVVRENISGNVIVFGDFNANGSLAEWNSSVMHSVLEDTNESITIRMKK